MANEPHALPARDHGLPFAGPAGRAGGADVERGGADEGAHVGGTECGNNWIGYIVHHAPGPMLAMLPTVEMTIRELRSLLQALRLARRTAWQTAVRVLTTVFVAVLLAFAEIKLKLFGGMP